jgi:hypothetical protein
MSATARATTLVPGPGTTIEGHTVESELHGHHTSELRYAVSGAGGVRGTLTVSPRRFTGKAEAARFRRLAERRAALDHPAAVRVRAIGEVGDRPMLITDAYPERTFADVLEDEAPLAPERVVAMLEPVAEALDLAGAHGLVHRNLTGHSLLLADDRLLLDSFGLLADEDAPARTVAAARDLRYRPPEQAAGEPLGRTANVYSLAALVLHALRGAAPYEGERRTVMYSAEAEPPSRGDVVFKKVAHAVTGSARFGAGPQAILHARLTPVPLRVSERMPHLGKAIDRVIARGMAEDPAKRHASATELLSDVAGALGVGRADAAGGPAARPRLQLVTERTQPLPPVVVAAPPRRSRRLLAVAGVAAALACGAAAALALTPFGHDEPARARVAPPATWRAVDEQRVALREQLAASRTPNAQAASAQGLAGLYAVAARAGGPHALRTAARDAGSAYTRLAAAAANGDAGGYAQAADAVDRAEAHLSLAASRH